MTPVSDHYQDSLITRRSIFIGVAASLICAPAIVRATSLMPVRGVIMPLGRLHWELDHPGEPYPSEGFCRRLFFSWCQSALKAHRPGPLTEDKMHRIVGYARRYGFLN
jgi:hypothetical protein